MLKTSLLAFLLVFFFTTSSQAGPESTAYMTFIAKRSGEMIKLKDNLSSGKLCPGNNFECLSKEMQNFGVRSATDAVLAIAVISAMVLKAKENPCNAPCKSMLSARLIDLQLTALSTMDLKNFFIYKDITTVNSETNQLRAVEDFQTFSFLNSLREKLIPIIEGIDAEAIVDLKLSRSVKDFMPRLDAITNNPEFFKRGYLATVPDADRREVYNVVVGNDPKKRPANIELLTKFVESQKRLK